MRKKPRLIIMPKKIYKKAAASKPTNKGKNQFFTKNGKELKNYDDYNAIFSLREEEEKQALAPSILEEKDPKPFRIALAIEKAHEIRQNLKKQIKELKSLDKFKLSMISLGINAALIVTVVFLVANNKTSNKYAPKYSIFSSKPLTSLAASTNLFGGDTRAATLDKIFEAYKCPLAGYGKTFVKEADKNGVPYWLTAAIAFQESSCGKVTPQVKIAGQEDVTNPQDLKFEESYNAWGWGVWGENIRTFNSWEEGIASVSKYLGDKFFSQGITDTCEIMEIYTPPSDGSWCRGVNYFGEMIQTYKSPES